MEEHHRALERIRATVRSFHDRKAPFRIYHGSTNSTRPQTLDASQVVDTSSLSHILSIDRASKSIIVEPNVPMDALVAFTTQHSLIPPVVPEFPGITVGGAFSGTAGESSSFRHGYFDRCVAWVEIILADGEVVRASADEHSDLFYGAVGAMGTLGITTLFELRLVPAAEFVELEYLQVGGAAQAVQLIRAKSEDANIDYLDGILLSPTHGVIIIGRMVHNKTASSAQVQTFTRPTDPWFFQHAAAQPTATKELTPLASYLFRYDRGAFWMGHHTLHTMFGLPTGTLIRALLDPLLRTRKLYAALHHSGLASRNLIQDLAVPGELAPDFLAWLAGEMPCYPLWLCPVKGEARAAMQSAQVPESFSDAALAGRESRMLLNVGLWGRGYADDDGAGFVRDNRRLEAEVAAVGGKKWLYARTFYTEEEFWAVHDRPGYEELRRRWRAETLPSVFQKVGPKEGDVDVPIQRVRGLLWALLGKEWILKGR